MKVLYSLAFLIFSFWLQSSLAVCPQEWYPLYCRGGGGFTLENVNISGEKDMTNLQGTFKKNAYPYSRFGARGVQAGSCAWYDRVINDSEPNNFRFAIYSIVVSTQFSMNLLTQCAPSLNCFMTLCAKNYGGGVLDILGVNISTTFGPP